MYLLMIILPSQAHAVFGNEDPTIEPTANVAAAPTCSQAPDYPVYIPIETPDGGSEKVGAQGLIGATQGAIDMCKTSYEAAVSCQNKLNAVKVSGVGASTGYRATANAGSASVNAAMADLETAWTKCNFDQGWGRRYCFDTAEASDKALGEYKGLLANGHCEITVKRKDQAQANLVRALKYMQEAKALWRQAERQYQSSNAALKQAGAAIAPVQRAVSSDDDGVI